MKAAVLALLLVLVLNMPEMWHDATPWDVWAADQVAIGLLIASAPFWARYSEAASLAALFGLARTGCTALWPEASDENGSICDQQTGLGLTVGFLGVALLMLLKRVHRG